MATSSSMPSLDAANTADTTDKQQWQRPGTFEDSDILLLQQEHHLQQQLEQEAQHVAQTQPGATAAHDLQQDTPDGSWSIKARRHGTLHLTADERLRVRTLYFDGGRTKKEIARLTGYSFSQVRTAIRQPVPKRRPGRPRKDGSSPRAVAIAAAAAAAAAQAAGPRARCAPVNLWEAGQTMTVPMAMAQQALNHGAPTQSPPDDQEESSDDLESDNEDEVGVEVEAEGQDTSSGTNSDQQHHGTTPDQQHNAIARRGRPPKTHEVTPQMNLNDNTKTIVLVTNASSGIGHAIVSALCLAYCPSITSRPASGGPYHVFLADRDYVHASNAARGLTCHHSNTVSPLQLDTRHPQSVMNAARFIHETVGRVDVLVLNNSHHERSNNGGRPAPGDPVSILRDMLETNLVSSYAVSEGLKWLLMAQPTFKTPDTAQTPTTAVMAQQIAPNHKDKRLIHVTSPLSSITLRQCQTRSNSAPSAPLQGQEGNERPPTSESVPPSHQNMNPSNTPLPEYRMALAAMNMLAACQAAAAQAAGVRIGVWNSSILPQPPMPPDLARQPGSGPETPNPGGEAANAEKTERANKRQKWRKQNAGGPGISQEQVIQAGKACVKVISGERDGDFGGFMDTFQGWVPW